MPLFLKPYRVKSNTQMKGSDKKKLKANLKKSFPQLTDDDFNTLLPNKEEIIVSKIFTFSEESVLLYIHAKNTVFFELEKDRVCYPSVYTLWKYPELVPFFTTWTPVMSRLANGADLMLPGVLVDEEKGIKAYGEGKLVKGDLVSVNLQSNIAPVAIGTAWLSSEDMYMAAKRGKCLTTVHFYGDQLWAAGTREQIPDLGPPVLSNVVTGDYEGEDSEGEVAEAVADLNIECSDALTDDKELAEVEENDLGDGEAIDDTNIGDVDIRTPQEIMDEHLELSFFQSLKTSASVKKAEFPMLTSNFFRLHMVTSCPPGVHLDLKKSSHKKLSKFLDKMQKLGIVKIKELTKGVESIMSVNYVHEKVAGHRVIKYEVPEAEEEEDIPVLPCDRKYQPPKVVELYTVTAPVLKLFKTADIGKGKGLTGSEVRNVIVKYVKEQNLQCEDMKGKVQLDELLAEVVLAKGDNGSSTMKWEELQSFVVSKMSHGYSLQFQDQPALQFKGRLEPVELTTAKRSGNKAITLVNNLDTYQIDPAEFAHKCQVGVQASTTTHPAPHKKSGTEVMIQGNHIAYASKLLLEEYQIPKKYIKGTENAVKPKKVTKK